jgi:hypothetical protein
MSVTAFDWIEYQEFVVGKLATIPDVVIGIFQ